MSILKCPGYKRRSLFNSRCKYHTVYGIGWLTIEGSLEDLCRHPRVRAAHDISWECPTQGKNPKPWWKIW